MSPDAGLLRTGRRAPVPAPLVACLETVFGEPVGAVQVIEHAWLMRLHGRAIATTRPGRIYLRGSAATFFASPWLLLHEYFHVLRQWQPGTLTRAGYLLESLRRGYWNNCFEIEARDFADQHSPELLALLQATDPSFRAVEHPQQRLPRAAGVTLGRARGAW